MVKLKAALVQMAVTADKRANLETAERYAAQAAEAGADLVVLPEMFNCPYSNDSFPIYAEPEGGETHQFLSKLAGRLGIWLVAGSIPERARDGKLYNTSFVFDRRGRQVAKHSKMHLFDIDIEGGQRFKESDTLSAGSQVTVFETEFGRVGLAICYDLRFPELARMMVDQGAKILVVPAAFNMTTGPAHWEILFRNRALDNQAYVLGAAPARDVNGPYVSYAHSLAVSPWGDVIEMLEAAPGMILAELDMDYVEKVRRELPLLAHRRHDVYTLKQCKV